MANPLNKLKQTEAVAQLKGMAYSGDSCDKASRPDNFADILDQLLEIAHNLNETIVKGADLFTGCEPMKGCDDDQKSSGLIMDRMQELRGILQNCTYNQRRLLTTLGL